MGAGAAEHPHRGRFPSDGALVDPGHPGDLRPCHQRRLRPVVRRYPGRPAMSDDENDLEEWVLPPQQRHGTFLVFDFEGAHERVSETLELIAAWLRGCAEYQLEQIAVSTDEVGWSVLSVTVQELMPGDLMQA